MSAFDPSIIKSFHFVSRHYSPECQRAEFSYGFDNGVRFVEQIHFHGARGPFDAAGREALARCLDLLHLMLGISYFKAAVPPRIVVETEPLSPATAAFFDSVYLHGLGEFAFRNHLDLRGRISFPHQPQVRDRPVFFPLERRTAVPLGGGIDSIVTLEALRQADEPMVLFSLGDYPVARQVAQQANLPLITVTRRISPVLLDLNRLGAFNGHVPISALIACLLPMCGLLYGFDKAALSNERSANVGNLTQNGLEINHQYSKGLDFERAAAAHFAQRVMREFNYFSFLRPLSSLAIARCFSRLEAYHSVFRSCNRNFYLDESKRRNGWCLNCPKCRFTFLALAPFLAKEKLLAIFGHNLLDDAEQASGFDALIGHGAHKPFECVGEVDESLAALVLLSHSAQWRSDFVVQRFSNVVLPGLNNPQRFIQTALAFSPHHLLSPRFERMLHAYTGT